MAKWQRLTLQQVLEIFIDMRSEKIILKKIKVILPSIRQN